MITDFITGLFVGISISMVAMYAFLFYAKRKGWAELRIEPSTEADLSTRAVVDSLKEDFDEVNTRLKFLEDKILPYLRKKDD